MKRKKIMWKKEWKKERKEVNALKWKKINSNKEKKMLWNK